MVTLTVEDAGGALVGGLIGATQWDWLRIEILAVDAAHRGSGHGRTLVETAEEIARSRGCHSAWVDTFDFQSPAFYERLGYTSFGKLSDYPSGQSRRFLSKPLTIRRRP